VVVDLAAQFSNVLNAIDQTIHTQQARKRRLLVVGA